MKKYKVIINRKECISCGSCTSIVPRLLFLDPGDKLIQLKDSALIEGLLSREVDEADLADFRLAAEACPLSLIKIEE